MKKTSLLVLMILFVIICSACDSKTKQDGNTNNNTENQNIQTTYTMEKVNAGKYSFMVPNNGDKKYANGDTRQNFYTNDGETGLVWYSIECPILPPKDKQDALNVSSSAGKIIEFIYDNSNGIEQAKFINQYQDEYTGYRIISNINDSSDCMWFTVNSTDKNLVKQVINSLEW